MSERYKKLGGKGQRQKQGLKSESKRMQRDQTAGAEPKQEQREPHYRSCRIRSRDGRKGETWTLSRHSQIDGLAVCLLPFAPFWRYEESRQASAA